jgi:crossover junction endodeoxyribonuclease RusA
VIVLTLPYPISANRYWASRVVKSKDTGKWMAMTYVTPEAKAFREQCAWAASRAIRKPFEGRVEVLLELYPQRPQDWARRAAKDPLRWDDDVRCIDLGNAEKVLSDSLQGIVFTDDKWIWHLDKRRMEPDAAGARVVLRVSELALPASPQTTIFNEGVTA